MVLILATVFSALQWALIPFALLGTPLWSPFSYLQPILILLGVALTWRWMKGRDFWEVWDLGWVLNVLILFLVYTSLTLSTNVFGVRAAHPLAFAQRARSTCLESLLSTTSVEELERSLGGGAEGFSHLIRFEDGDWFLILRRSFLSNPYVYGEYCLALDREGNAHERWTRGAIELPPTQVAEETFLTTTTTATSVLFRRQLEFRDFVEVAIPRPPFLLDPPSY